MFLDNDYLEFERVKESKELTLNLEEIEEADLEEVEETGIVSKLEEDTYMHYAKSINTAVVLKRAEQMALFERNEELNAQLNKLIFNKKTHFKLLVEYLDFFKKLKKPTVVTFYDEEHEKSEEQITSKIENLKLSLQENKNKLEELNKIISIVKFEFPFVKTIFEENKDLYVRSEIVEAKAIFKEIEKNKNKLLQANLKLVIKIAKKYKNDHLLFVDLIQEGNIGLIKGIDKFKYRLGYRLSTYVSWWINQSIKDALTKKSRSIKLPSNVVGVLYKLKKMELEEGISRKSLSPDVLSEKLDISIEKIKKALNAPEDISSIDMPISTSSGDKDVFLSDLIEAEQTFEPEQQTFFVERKKEIFSAIQFLSEREKDILERRYGLKDDREQTLEEVGDYIGLTRERVRQIEMEALKKIRNNDEARSSLIALL